MRTLVTGGAGCIGSDLAAALLRRGEKVVVVDNLSSGKIEHIEPLRAHPHFLFMEGDLEDASFVTSLLEGFDMVWHLAANPDVKFVEGEATDKDLRQNTICTYNVLEGMRRQGVKKLAFSSTSAIYGISPVQPIPESAFVPQPISLYGATKLSCEAMISAFSNLFGIHSWIFRFANIVGPKVRKKGRTVIGDFILRLQQTPDKLLILGDGQQAKSYLLSEECVEAMLFTIDRTNEPMNVYNLGGEDWLQVTDIADLVVKTMGLSGVKYEFTGGAGGWLGDVPRFRLDPGAINRLGWKAKLTSEQAVQRAIESTLQLMQKPPTPS